MGENLSRAFFKRGQREEIIILYVIFALKESRETRLVLGW